MATKRATKPTPTSTQVAEALAWLAAHSSADIVANYAPRYGITASNALGVSMSDIKLLAKQIGRDHEFALALWDSGCYEARLLCSLVDDPTQVTPAQMDRWCRDFDNWGVCDTLCFNLFDRSAYAWDKVEQWSSARDEFVKRAAFALLASIALHDKKTADAPFIESLGLIERASDDPRNFVKKAVSWALRGVGRRNAALHARALALARRMVESSDATTRWIGRDAVKDLTGASAQKRISKR